MDISVIVPCYNNESYLPRCLDALSNQRYPRDRYEVILVDNMSKDRSAEIARQYGGVTVLREPKAGSYAARNTGVRAARGELLAFTDSDCEVCPDWLERIARAMEDEPAAVLLGGNRFADETLWLATLADYESEKARYVFGGADPAIYYGYTNNMAVKRQAYEQCGPFEEISRGADVVFVSRVVEARSCQAVRFVPEMTVRHLEISRWYSWHQKMWTYGRNYPCFRDMSHTRPLGLQVRLKILRRTIFHHHYSPARASLLLVTGAAAAVAYEMGRVTSNIRDLFSPVVRS